MQTRTPPKAAALLVAGALLGWRAASVGLATPVQAKDKAAASTGPDRTAGAVFVLANHYRRWELNELAGRLDSQEAAVELCDGLVPAAASSVSGLSPDDYSMLQAIGVWAVKVKPWLSRGMRLVTERLGDLCPREKRPDAI
jgi:hypothetical protein